MGKENFKEDLCCMNLRGRATGSEIFIFLYEYFSEKDRLGNWVCIDGVASMTGYRVGLFPKIKCNAQRNVDYSLHNPSGTFSCSETTC